MSYPLKKITDWSAFTLVSLLCSASFTVLGIWKNESWALNPWLLPVIAALIWGVYQER
jgi:hypothetical protein